MKRYSHSQSFKVVMGDNEKVLGSSREKSASASGTLSWTKDLSNVCQKWH